MDLFPYRLFSVSTTALGGRVSALFLMALSDMLSSTALYFCYRKSDIAEASPCSDILFATKTRKANITWAKPKYHCSAISLAKGE